MEQYPNGKYFVDIDWDISNVVSYILKLKGYEVIYITDDTKLYTKISW